MVETSSAVGRRSGRPPSIRREQIVAAALELGISGLTLRGLAERLGVSAQALYRYFPSLEALLDAVVDELDKRIPLPPDKGEDWCRWGYKFAYAVRRLLEFSPGLADRALVRTQPTMGVLSRYETSIRIALRSGFDHRSALWATRAVTEFVQSWVAREQRLKGDPRRPWPDQGEAVRAAVEAHAASELPCFAEALKRTAGADENARFDHGLRALLVGLGANRRSRSLAHLAPRG